MGRRPGRGAGGGTHRGRVPEDRRGRTARMLPWSFVPKVRGARVTAVRWGLHSAPPPPPVRASHGEDSREDPGAGGTWQGRGHSLERVHAKGHVHAGAVGQEGSQGCLLKQPEDQDLVPGGTGRAGPRELEQAPPSHRDRGSAKGRRTETDTETHRDGDRKRERSTDGSREMVTLKYKDRDSDTQAGV